MNVTHLRDRIVELAHDEATADSDLNTKGLNWLNNAYFELHNELSTLQPTLLETTESHIVGTSGSLTLPQVPQRVISVITTADGFVLKETTRSNVLLDDPEESEIGSPTQFWQSGQQLFLHPTPLVPTEVKVTYIPTLRELLETDTEADILLPPEFHYALIWGGLVWMTVHERNFSAQGDLALFQQKWDDAKQNIKLSLMNRTPLPLHTQTYAQDF